MSIFKSVVFSIAFALPMLASANIIDLTSGNTFLGAPSNTPIFSTLSDANPSDTFLFDVVDNGGILTSSISYQFSGANPLTGFSGTLDGSPLLFSSYSPVPGTIVQTLTGSLGGPILAGSHALVINRAGGVGSYGGNIDVAAPVPVPAALWLMGSAMVGLVSLKRRKNGLAA